jgi:hypothetical protein
LNSTTFRSQIYYENFDEAFEAASKAEIVAVIDFSANFSESLVLFNSVEDLSDSGNIRVYLDQTDFQKSLFIKRKLYEIFQSFSQNLMTKCGNLEAAGRLPITFEGLFGKMDFNFRGTLIPGFIFA